MNELISDSCKFVESCLRRMSVMKMIRFLPLVLSLFLWGLPSWSRSVDKEQFLNVLFKGHNYPVTLSMSPTYPWKADYNSVKTTSRQDDVGSNCWFALDIYVPQDSASVTFDYRVRYHKETYGYAKYADLTCLVDNNEVFKNNGTDKLETATIKIGHGYHTLKWNLYLGEAWENWDYFSAIENMRFEGISDGQALPEYSKPYSGIWTFPNEAVTDTIVIENLGKEDFVISSLEGLTSPFYIKSVSDAIAPGSSGSIIVGYEPQDEGCHEQTLTIMSNLGRKKISYAGVAYETEPVCNPAPGKLSDAVRNTGIETLAIFGPMSRTDNYHLAKLKDLKYLDLRGTDMEYIFNGGVNNLYKLEDILLPSTLKYIDATWFWKHWDRDKGDLYYNIKTITCMSPEPPQLVYYGGGSEDYSFDGLRSDVIVYVPVQYMPYYESDEKWNKFNIMPIMNDSKTIRVVVDDSILGRYTGCPIVLSDKLVQRTQRLTVGGASEYVFHNVKQGRSYSLSLLHPSKQVLSFKDSIMIGDGREMVVRFDSIVPMYTASCEVMGSGDILTDRVQMSWFKSGEDNIIGNEVKRLLEGDTVRCAVSLPKAIGLEYMSPDTVCHIVNSEDNRIIIRLNHHIRHLVKGRVVNNESKPLKSAMVTINQTLNGNLPWNKTLKVDASGCFETEINEGPVVVGVFSDRYFSIHHTDTISGMTDFRDFTLSSCSGRKITVGLTFKENALPDKDAYMSQGYDNWKELDFSVYDSETGLAIENVKVEYPYIYILDELGENTSVKVKVASRKNAFKDIETIADNLEDGNFSAEMQIVEYGDVKVSYNNADCSDVMALVYDKNNNIIKSGKFVNGSLMFRGIKDGEYHLVAMEANSLYNNVSDFSDFEKLGLEKEQNYGYSLVTVETGLISEVIFDNIPQMARPQQIAGSNTYLTPNKNTVVAGNYFTVKASVEIKPDYIGKCENLALNVAIPDSCRFVPNSLLVGSELAAFNIEGRMVKIPISEDTEPIRFCVLPLKGGMANVSAYLSYEKDGESCKESVGGFVVDVTGISLNVLPTVKSPSIVVSGTGMAGSDVEIMDDGMLIGRTTVLENGNWQTTVGLCDDRDLKTHSLYSRLATPKGDILYSETKHVRVNTVRPYVRRIEMINTNPNENVTVFDFDNPFGQKKPYSYNSSYPNFTFKVWFGNLNDPVDVKDAVLWVKTTDGKDIPVELVASVSDSSMMIGTRSFPSSWSLPSNVAVAMNNIDYSVLMPENVLDILDESMSLADMVDIRKEGKAVSYELVSKHGDLILLCGGVEYDADDDMADKIERIISRFAFDSLPGDDSFLVSPSNGVLWLKRKDDGNVFAFFLYDISASEEYNSVMSMLDKKLAKMGQERVQVDWNTGYLVPNRSCFTLSNRIDKNMQYLIDICNKKLDCVEKLGEPDRDYAAQDLKESLNAVTHMNLAMVATVIAGTHEIAGSVPSGENMIEDLDDLDDMIGNVEDVATAMEGITKTARLAIENIMRYPTECGLSSSPDFVGTGVTPLIDPSGYVYEAVESNRLEGVRTTAYFKTVNTDGEGNTSEKISVWDASVYEQENPLYTDSEGRYSWDVPAGLWQVKYEKDGYETVSSDWLPVPPPQMEVNMGMKQLINPDVVSAFACSDSVCFTFTKYMDANMLTLQNIEVSKDGLSVDGDLKLVDAEKTEGKVYASKVTFVPKEIFGSGDIIELSVSSKVKSYAGCPLLDNYVDTLIVRQPVRIKWEETSDIMMGDTVPVRINVHPTKGVGGHILTVCTGSESIVSIDKTEICLTDEELPVVVNLNGILPGTTILTAGIEDLGVAEQLEIQVLNSLKRQTYAPWATIESGTCVDEGTKLYLFCATPEAAIYYTTDGTCPCDVNTRILYNPDLGIDIPGDVTVRACAVADGMSESEVVEMSYTVNAGSCIGVIKRKSEIVITPACLSDGNNNVSVLFDSEQTALVEVFDVQGSKIAWQNVRSGGTISLAGVPKGVYIISVNLSRKRKAGRIIKL